MTIYAAVALLFALQIKHLIADFYFQPSSWLVNKHCYFSVGGALHALLHAILSFFILYLFTRNLMLSLIISVVECVVHFHIDWFKASLGKLKAWKTDQQVYWWAFGSDQALHHITYLVMMLAVERFA